MRFARSFRNPGLSYDISRRRTSNAARILLIFSYGLFTIAAQSLLFREFITTFEGNDISVGIFFGSWFLWVALGAQVVYRAKGLAEILLKNIEFLFLCYLPAFVLELILIIQARQLAGIESYALLPVQAIVLLSIVVNAPVSIITGMLFPLACRWVQSASRPLQIANGQKQYATSDKRFAGSPVSGVYILEAAGSFVGGLGVTVLLALGASLARIFFILAFIVSLSVLCVRFANRPASLPSERRGGPKLNWCAAILLPLSVVFCLAPLAGLAVGADKGLMRYVRTVKWSRLLPADALTGSFQTAQAEYFYGIYHDQWIAVRQGSVTEALPDESTTGRLAAAVLAQNPDARRTLVIGSGLGLCYQFLKLPQTETVSWAHCDSQYVQQVDRFIPPGFKVADERLHKLTGDIRSLLDNKKQYYDIVILNLPEATSSVLNRYYTLEFYQQVKESLGPDGVLAVRIAGGENIMGTELVNLGASTKLTLERVFSRLVLTPGEDTWFIASDSEKLTGEPGVLRERFAAIAGASDVFPPEALLSVYLPDRAAVALENYSSADLPESKLVNRDSRPLTHLYSLLLAAKQSEAPAARFVKHLVLAGPLAFIIPILVLVVLRVIYISRFSSGEPRLSEARPSEGLAEGRGSHRLSAVLSVVASESAVASAKEEAKTEASAKAEVSSFDSTLLVFLAGWVAIGVVIVMMYLYQTRFGSLYLHIGVISSVFMVGLTAGATLTSWLVARRPGRRSPVTGNIFAVILVHSIILAAIALWPGEQWTQPVFVIAFVLCGLCAGCYFPLAARQLSDSAFETGLRRDGVASATQAGLTGSKLETADHLGASAGGLLTGLALVPVLGTKAAMFVFVMLLMANVPAGVLRIYKRGGVYSSAATAFKLRKLGYILFGIGVCVILCSNLLARAGTRLKPPLPRYAAQALAGELQIEQASATLADGPRKLNYFNVYEPRPSEGLGETGEEGPERTLSRPGTVRLSGSALSSLPKGSPKSRKITGYIFSSQELAPEVCGFGGNINLAVYVDATGRLIDFHIIRSNETPAYLELLGQWRELLKGHQLFRPQSFADVDAVTGATVSSRAILSALETSGHRFAAQILGQVVEAEPKEKTPWAGYLPDTHGIYLLSAFVLALLVIYRGGFWSRLAILLFNLVVGGIILNAQYSSEQIATILSLHSPALGLTGAFLLVAAVPLLVMVFGNIYCGYICPFGAAQEVLGYIVPDRFKQPVSTEKMRKARFVKYVVLFVLIIVFFVSRDRTTLASDPLIEIFNLRFYISNFQSSIVNWQSPMFLIVAVALLGSLFYARFWCWYLCPVGAFLSLLNRAAILRRALPARRFGRCEFGLTAKDRMDCLYCDRCRYETKTAVMENRPQRLRLPRPFFGKRRGLPTKLMSRYFVVGVLAAAALVSAVSVKRFLQVIPAGFGQAAISASAAGQPRDVDIQRIRTMIRQRKLSDKEAEFYKKVD